MGNTPVDKKTRKLTPYLGMFGFWGLAFGCAVGQGAFVMPGSTFLPIAGPVGTVAGIAVGALVMIVLAYNYHCLMNRYPDSGGTYTYTKKCFGYDHGFLSAWFLILTYVAILWANATALPFIARVVFGNLFQFGFHYVIAGYDVYLGEILLSMFAVFLGAVICLKKRFATTLQAVMGVALLFIVAAVFVAALLPHDHAAPMASPSFSQNESALSGMFTIFALTPWAFAGFESVSHSAGEVKFSLKKAFPILVVALLTGAFAYIALALLATAAVPETGWTWADYIANLGQYTGTASQPTFFAAQSIFGTLGKYAFGIAALCGIFTGLIGNYVAVSRLAGNMAEDRMLPEWVGKTDRNHVPRRAILTVFAASLIIPLFGRAAISWIVDVTTVGGTIAYVLTSAAALKIALEEKSKNNMVFALIGLVFSGFFVIAFLIPNLISVKTLATESYLIFAAWGMLGFLMVYYILRKDRDRRIGRSNIAFIIMLGLVIFTSTVWIRQSTDVIIERAAKPIQTHYVETLKEEGIEAESEDTDYLRDMMEKVDAEQGGATAVQIGLIVVTVGLLFVIYSRIQKREKQIEVEKMLAEESSRAKTSFLSNMSHEIRTPMNAIIGLNNIVLRDHDLSPETREHLEKMGASAKHLLGLINDILDMSRIESGRMVLKDEEFLFRECIEQVNIIIHSQCLEKGLQYACHIDENVRDHYIGDDMKLKQVLINILGNAVKFTEAPGEVALTVKQIGEANGIRTLSFEMRDTGIGMEKEYLPKIFESFSQEDATSTNRYGGSGLGMAITKNFVDMLGGTIEVESEKGVGSVFIVTIPLGASDRKYEPEKEHMLSAEDKTSLAGKRILIAEDVDANAEILTDLLELEEMEVERAENGQQAVELFADSPEGHFDAILMDVRMPLKDGLEATKEIRALARADAQTIPIFAMTANVFDEDVERSHEAGMNTHLSKPIDPDLLYAILREYFFS